MQRVVRDQDREVEFAGNVYRFADENFGNLISLRAGLMGDQNVSDHLGG